MSVRVAIASSFTAEPTGDYLRYWLDRLGLPGEVSFAPYNQVLQQLLDPTSLLGTNAAGLNAVFVRPSDLRADDAAAIGVEGSRSLAVEIAGAVTEHRTRAAVPLLVVLCPEATGAALTDAFARELELRLRGLRGVELRTPAEMLETYPLEPDQLFDPGADTLGKIPYTNDFYAALATVTARTVYGEVARRPKAIAVDCDNTLWHGVCGETSCAELTLPPHCLELQRFLVAQVEAGVLVCLCSKNAQSDVERVFDQRRDMPLSWAHVAAHRINWAPKSANITELARHLDLSRDSFVFIDDNPVECAEVEAGCPDVLVISAPTADAARFFDHLWPLDLRASTDEDRRRTEFYRSNAQRAELEGQASSFADFIRDLRLRVDVDPAGSDDIARVVQLTRRTTQFNTTGVIFDAPTVAEYRDDDARVCLVARVTDRFGSYGIVGACFARFEGEALGVDALQFSCRALGRGAEHRFAARIGELAVARGLAHVDFRYTETERNAPARAFIASLGTRDGSGEMVRCAAAALADLEFDPERVVPRESTPSKVSGSTGWAMDSSTAVEIASVSHSMRAVRDAVRHRRASLGGHELRPRDEYEGILGDLWAEVLEIDAVDIGADVFTEYGASSVHAMRVVAALQRRIGAELAPEKLLTVPTVVEQARIVRDGAGHELLVPLRREGSGEALFLIHPAGGTSFAYLSLAKMLEGRPVWGVQDPHILGTEGHHESVHAMSREYVAAIREVQPHGPYLLGGWSLGGTVAFEMGAQLEADGEQVRLFLFDPFAPGHGLRPTVMTAYWAAQSRLWALATRVPRLGRLMFRRLRQSEDPWERIGMILLSRMDRVEARALARLAFPDAIELRSDCSESEAWRKLFDHATRQAPEKVLPGATPENTFHRLRVMAGHARLETRHATTSRFRGPATLYTAEGSSSIKGWSRVLTGSFAHVPVRARAQGRLRTPHTAFLHEHNLPLFIDDLRRRLDDEPAASQRTTQR